MIKENIDLIQSLVKNRKSMYGILSFTSDTFEIIKSNVYDIDLSEEEQVIFNKAMKSILKGMYEIDSLLNRVV
jgi:hypothetical protein